MALESQIYRSPSLPPNTYLSAAIPTHNAFESLRDPGLYLQALGLMDGCALSQNIDARPSNASVTVPTSEPSAALLRLASPGPVQS